LVVEWVEAALVLVAVLVVVEGLAVLAVEAALAVLVIVAPPILLLNFV
jgi:hypothetical protein